MGEVSGKEKAVFILKMEVEDWTPWADLRFQGGAGATAVEECVDLIDRVGRNDLLR
jgi:hypothetical protein